MRRKLVVLAALIDLLALGGGYGRGTSATDMRTRARTPVIVELYTSEGCSDCPPADAVLSELAQKQPVPGAEIIPLEWHVDYWNSALWSDRFSSHAFSARQNDYADSFHNATVYTPQMIVDGRTEFVGGDEGRAVQAIAHAARAPKADVEISLSGAGDSRRLQIRVDHLPSVSRGDTAQVILAVTEDGLTSRVRGGENNGHFLRHSAVVRQIGLVGTTQSGMVFNAAPELRLGRDWNPAHLRAVVFVQTVNRRQVLGAAALGLG